MHGVFNINKPVGATSHDVVAAVRRLLRDANPAVRLRVGHAGTLDPLATGVLPIVVGNATRLVEYLSDAGKAYRAAVTLGATSNTYDAEGTLTPTFQPGAYLPSLDQVRAALARFLGPIDQFPPMHSAVKVGGKKLYELARQGIEVERTPRRVTITRLDLEEYDPPTLRIFVECSKGTYIRSLAHDLGAKLGTGAYLSALTRTRHGPFLLEGSVTLDTLSAAFDSGSAQAHLYPPEIILTGWPEHAATPEQELSITQGKPLQLPPPAQETVPMLKVTGRDGRLLAIMYWQPEQAVWHPQKVFPPPF